MEEEIDDTNESPRPLCPYCDDGSGNCKHVLLDYDASFMDFLSGYLAHDETEIDNLKELLLELIKLPSKPVLKDSYLKDIWDYAVSNFNPGSEEIEFDIIAYMNYIEDKIDKYDGESYRYEYEDGMPNYSSAYTIFFAKDPKNTLRKINEDIIKAFKNFKK